jgi:hypothetical protein|uniref:hypothetical protein n=1 Tax=Algoriphagus sp. TaxID=1872435 RepID=UPI004047C205
MRKKILSLIFFTIILSGCGDQNVNVQNSGGFWHEIDGVGTIKKAIIGSEKDLGTIPNKGSLNFWNRNLA